MDGPFGGNSGKKRSAPTTFFGTQSSYCRKGDYIMLAIIVLLGSEGGKLIVLYDSTGGNENSTIMSNAADTISGHRTNSNESNPIPVNNTTIGNNWNGYDSQNTNQTVFGMLVSPENYDFRPVIGSELDQMGVGAYSSIQNASAPSGPDSFDPSTFYWLPGIKRNSSDPYQQTSVDIPCPSIYLIP